MALLSNLFIYALATLNEPGYLKAYEGAFLPNFIKGTLIIFIVFIILFLIGFGANRWLVKFRNK